MKKLNLTKKDLAFVSITSLLTGLCLLEKSFSKKLEKEIDKRDVYLNEALDQFDNLDEIYKEKFNTQEEIIKLMDERLVSLDPEYEYRSTIHQKVIDRFSKEES